ncbi:MAG: phosphotransferase family protein [Pseudomonadales bacterium]|nr:phosphotransferase family protein [Pseudomonadales bacterium]
MSAFEEALARVLQQHIADYRSMKSVDRLSGGASQETYRIIIESGDGERMLAMRRTPGGMHVEPTPGHPGLPTEALLMQSARAAGVPEPEVYYVLEAADELGDGFIMEWLEGEALGARIVRSERFEGIRPKLAYECGKVMARIHAIDLARTGLEQRLAHVSPKDFVDQTWTNYKNLATPQPMIDYAARWLMDNLPDDYEPALVHNDFRNGNFMLDENGIVAVLDWELAHIGDPMRDLGWICVNSWRFGADKPVGGFGEYEDLFAGYEAESGKPVDPARVKFWEVFGSFWWAVGCLGMAEHYRSGPDKTVERPAIGRRSSECQVDCVNLLIPGDVQLIEPDDTSQDVDMPRADELLVSVRDFLRNDVMNVTQGRNNFMARVASNSLDIVLREWAIASRHKQAERERLEAFYEQKGTLADLRWRLVNGLRDGSLSLDDERLTAHLRQTVVNQIAIDQPRYTGLATALKAASAGS